MNKQKIRSIGWEISKLIVPAFVGFLFAYITFSKQYDANEKGRLNDNLNKLLDIDIQHPYVEDSSFIAWWSKNKNSNKDSALIYQTYCEYVFNFLQNTCEYFKYDKEKIDAFVDMGDLVRQHIDWFNSPEDKNSDSYPKRFIDFLRKNY